MQQYSTQELIDRAEGLSARLLAFSKDKKWQATTEIRSDKVCRIYNMELGDRLASMGIVEDVDGTPEEIRELLEDEEVLMKLYPAAKEYKILNQVTKDVNINTTLFKGKGPVSQRYIVCLDNLNLNSDKSLYVYSSHSINFPYEPKESAVKADVILSGLIAQDNGNGTSKVIYIADSDLKGCLPMCIQRRALKNGGELAGNINKYLKERKNKK